MKSDIRTSLRPGPGEKTRILKSEIVMDTRHREATMVAKFAPRHGTMTIGLHATMKNLSCDDLDKMKRAIITCPLHRE